MSNVFKVSGGREAEIEFSSWEELEKQDSIKWYKKFPINCSMMKFHTFSLRHEDGTYYLLAEYNTAQEGYTKIVIGTLEQDVDGLPSETGWSKRIKIPGVEKYLADKDDISWFMR